MNYLTDFIQNKILMTALISWGVAQLSKTIVDLLMSKQFHFERLFGDGGMPSCHSAMVCALAAISALTHGFQSFEFSISAVFALVVMHDASGVRRETGNQAVLLNEMIAVFQSLETPQQRMKFSQEKTKELIGHTPFQVYIGGILGVAVACFMHYVVYL